MSYVFGSLLYYQAKKAISPEYEHQRSRERISKEELDRNQANVAKSIDTNISWMMPNGDLTPKKNPKDGGLKTMIGQIMGTRGTLIDGILEVTNPKLGREDAIKAHTKVEQERIDKHKSTFWEKTFNLLFKNK